MGAPVGVWSALASMPGADTFAVSCSSAGAVGTYSCALMVLLESAMPRAAAAVSRSSGGTVGRGAAGGRRRSVLVELYVGVVVCMPLAAVAQASLIAVEMGGKEG